MAWILVIGLVVVLVIFFLKFKEMRHRLGSFFMVGLLVLFIASILQVYMGQNADLSTFGGLVSFGETYFSWVGGVFSNLIHISGYAVKQNWGVSNSSLNKTIVNGTMLNSTGG